MWEGGRKLCSTYITKKVSALGHLATLRDFYVITPYLRVDLQRTT